MTFNPLCLTVVLLFLIICIGSLVSLTVRSTQNGGIMFFDSPEFPLVVTFLTLYLPTVLAILFGLCWSWVDLDVKRLEPFFQMSKPGGARAVDSVLLHYPFEYLAVVPIQALRKR